MLATEQGVAAFSPEELVDRIHAGEQDAEQELVSQYWRSLYFILNRRANDPELAADMAQETFIVVINKARSGEIENPAALSAFIRQVGVNLLIASYRKDSRRKTDTSEDIQVQFPDDSVDTLTKLNSAELTQIVKQVMEELPTVRDKDLLYRYFVYGQTKTVICEEFELTPAHFDRVLHRARNRLKQILEMKFGIDLSKSNLSSLLGLVVFIWLASSHSGDSTLSANKIENKVGEHSTSMHLSTIAVMERPSYELDAELYQQETRWT